MFHVIPYSSAAVLLFPLLPVALVIAALAVEVWSKRLVLGFVIPLILDRGADSRNL